jgi:hypothetical protein
MVERGSYGVHPLSASNSEMGHRALREVKDDEDRGGSLRGERLGAEALGFERQ